MLDYNEFNTLINFNFLLLLLSLYIFRYYHLHSKKIIYSFQTTILYISKLDIVYLILKLS